MAIRFDHNNNSEEWQMLFNKINNGSKACFLYMKTSRVQHLI